jgi:hypothetical protein
MYWKKPMAPKQPCYPWHREYEDQMNYDESKVSKPRVKRATPSEPIKLVDDSPGWGVFLFLAAFVAIGVMLAMYIKRPAEQAPMPPVAIEAPKEPLKPGQSWKEPNSARDTFNENFGR